ncbi:dihydroneopterin aldolase [Candidatus Tachikawaea gelatinosa]|uniref:7,8-dihydroneopterin aldolase n=1 Tax=Candidatus Tachikawaea gelatinosa TaxID=1410383 RepID=A0A090AS09_9ENTR|nr:dihydroneopterin aldolase [Candidatus Tachikawaea gelatinosa]BAP58630.1 dihydroneopterin aldolase [Candidatus Tachikawaea gelatinosa]
MDIIFIEELVVFAKIGIYAWEKKIQQKLILDIKISWRKNELDRKYINYSHIVSKILIYIANKKFSLIESFAEEIAALLMQSFKILGVCIKVRKPNAIIQAKNAGIRIKRGIF